MLSGQVIDDLVFIKVKGGWINPDDIMWVQTAKYNELMLIVGLPGLERPIHLNEEDSANLTRYMEEHTWIPEEEKEFIKGELEDAV